MITSSFSRGQVRREGKSRHLSRINVKKDGTPSAHVGTAPSSKNPARIGVGQRVMVEYGRPPSPARKGSAAPPTQIALYVGVLGVRKEEKGGGICSTFCGGQPPSEAEAYAGWNIRLNSASQMHSDRFRRD